MPFKSWNDLATEGLVRGESDGSDPTLVRTGAARIHSIIVTAAAGGWGGILVYDAVSASGTAIQVKAQASDTRQIIFRPAGLRFDTGIYVDDSGTAPTYWAVLYTVTD
jgi:hypothetical protein